MSNIIYVVGDSHSLFWSGTNGIKDANRFSEDIPILEKHNDIFKCYNIGPSLAYSINNYKSKSRGRENFEYLLKTNVIPKYSRVLLCFGEIDCRVHLLKNGFNSMIKRLNDCIYNYFYFIDQIKDIHISIYGPVASLKDSAYIDPNYPRNGTEYERNITTFIFNKRLQEECIKRNIFFYTNFNFLINDDFTTKDEFFYDGCHLSNKIYSIAKHIFLHGLELCENRNNVSNTNLISTRCADDCNIIKSINNNYNDLKYILSKFSRKHRFIGNSLFTIEEFIRNQFFTQNLPVNDSYYIYMKKIKQLLSIVPISTDNFVRYGSHNDGGYVFYKIDNVDKIAFCFGISNDCNFEDDLVKDGYDVYMYDHTIINPPNFKHNINKYHYYKLGLSDVDDINNNLHKLDYYIKSTGNLNKTSMLLKIDVEGCEYKSLLSVDDYILDKFYTLIIELHNLTTNDLNMQNLILSLLRKLNNIYIPIHIHWNNFGRLIVHGDLVIPLGFEVTFLNKRFLPKQNMMRILPLQLDTPCNPEYAEHNVNYAFKDYILPVTKHKIRLPFHRKIHSQTIKRRLIYYRH